MKIAIYSRTSSNVDADNLQKLLDHLHTYEIVPMIYEPFYKLAVEALKGFKDCQTFSKAEDLERDVEFMISMGGDGTLLESLCYVRERDIPIVGINFGRLGFLSIIGKDNMDGLVKSLIHRTYQVERRNLIHVDSNLPLFGDIPYGLNDFGIHKKDSSAMIKIPTYINGTFLNTYWADGLIVSTPTGSTAYSMSCGGPIVLPETSNFIITPVAPHNLNVRPIVVSDDSEISFEIGGRGDQFLCSLDTRMETIDRTVKLSVREEHFTVGLIRYDESDFLKTLRDKLLWGADKRN